MSVNASYLEAGSVLVLLPDRSLSTGGTASSDRSVSFRNRFWYASFVDSESLILSPIAFPPNKSTETEKTNMNKLRIPVLCVIVEVMVRSL